MNIKKAIDRIHFRLSKNKMYQQDVDAINTIIDYVNAQDNKIYMENLLFAKLFLEKFTSLALRNNLSSRNCMAIIENILKTPLSDLVSKFSEQVPMFKFNYESLKFKTHSDPFNFTKIIEEHSRIAEQHKTELYESLHTKYTEEEAAFFIKNQVNRLSKIYNTLENEKN